MQKSKTVSQPVLLKAQSADINESDTVTIITDMLCDIFGYDKYDNITSEFAIKKTFCDLAIKLDGKIPLLIECKSAGIDLKDDHVRQATNYAADAGIEWVVLTNGIYWRVFKIIFSKPVEKKLVYNFNFCELSNKKQTDIEMLYYLCKEAFTKSSKNSLEELHAQKQIFNKYIVGQIMLTDTVIAFLNTIQSNGYYSMFYTNLDFSGRYLEFERISDNFDIWCAGYSIPEPNMPCGMWQYSQTGEVDGTDITGLNGSQNYVDLDISYKNYPAKMKKYHLNGY